MNRNTNHLFQVFNKKNILTSNQDQNQHQNHTKTFKHLQNKSFIQKPIKEQYPKPQDKPTTSYRLLEGSKQYQNWKWTSLQKFFLIASKAQMIFHCKIQTLLMAYSIAQKTINIVLNGKLSFEYWTICCLFISMKFEQIYHTKLKDLRILFKTNIKTIEYNQSQYLILEKLGFDLNFINLNTILSQFIHVIPFQDKHFMYYLLEIALSQRRKLQKFTLKQIVFSIVYILASRNLDISSRAIIDGIKVNRIQQCSKFIILAQTNSQSISPQILNKYKDKATNFVSIRPLPVFQSMTNLILKKYGKQERISTVIPLKQKRIEQQQRLQKMDEQ